MKISSVKGLSRPGTSALGSGGVPVPSCLTEGFNSHVAVAVEAMSCSALGSAGGTAEFDELRGFFEPK